MRILIDTHILIWYLEGNSELQTNHRSLIADPANIALISVASFWEIAIKSSRGKLSHSQSIQPIVDNVENSTGSILLIEPKHGIGVAQLPNHHKDPLDRMIIAQPIVEDVPLITADSEFQHYGVELL